jgi:hypothetical protein
MGICNQTSHASELQGRAVCIGVPRNGYWRECQLSLVRKVDLSRRA